MFRAGAVLASPGHEPAVVRSLDARLVWLADEPFNASRGYLLRTATDLVPVSSIHIKAHLHLDSLTERPASSCAANDIAVARVDLGRRAVAELFSQQRETGSFMLIDAVTGASVAGGVVIAAHGTESKRTLDAFQLTRSLLKQGVGADLGHDAASEEELRRRANEVAILLRGAGVAVHMEDQWSRARIDAATVWLSVLMALSFAFVSAIVFGVL